MNCVKTQIITAVQWLVLSVACGIVCGGGAIALSALADAAYSVYAKTPWLVFLLPVCACATLALYHVTKTPFDLSTVDVLFCNRTKKEIPARLAPCIMVGTALSLLGGGSVGKEAAALQLGGALCAGASVHFSRLNAYKDTLVMAGIAAAFSALLFAPVTAVLFVIEVMRLKRKQVFSWRMLCVAIASFVAWGLSCAFDIGCLWDVLKDCPLAAHIFPEYTAEAVLLGLLAALVGVSFVIVLKLTRTLCFTFIRNNAVRVIVGSVVVMCLLFAGGGGYSGTGAIQITAAITGQTLPYEAFAWKAAITVLCLGFGLKGGEIMPLLCIGACLGCSLGVMTGVDTAFLSAVGMVSLFATCTACPFAALALSVEAFGVCVLPCCVIAVFCSCVFTRKFSLYNSETWIIPLGKGKGQKL
jgi:H+/Cl- antiporter ClcA